MHHWKSRYRRSLHTHIFTKTAYLISDPYANPVDMAIGGLVDKVLHLQSYDRIPHLFQHNNRKSTYTEAVRDIASNCTNTGNPSAISLRNVNLCA